MKKTQRLGALRVLHRYVCKEFLRLLLLCQTIFLSLYLIIDFVQRIDNFIGADVSKGVIFRYFFYKTPHIIAQMIPVATLISVIILVCTMKRNNEIMAMRACGVDILKFSRTIVLFSLVVVISLFLLSDLVVPFASTRSNKIWKVDVKKQDLTSFYGSDQIWYKSSDAIYYIRHFDSENKVMEDPTFYFFDNTFHLIKRIDGKTGIWQGQRWIILDGIIQEAQEDGSYKLRKLTKLPLAIPETPETFITGVKKPEDMSYGELKRFSRKVRQEGYDNTRYLVDMDFKIAFPFISLILVILGIPIALRIKKGGAPLAVSVGIGICFLYVLILGLSRSLGLSGILPSLLSAWTANLIFFFLGTFLLMNIER